MRYKLRGPYPYQTKTLQEVIQWRTTAKIGDVKIFYISEDNQVGLHCVWLTDDEVAVRTLNSGIETTWRCINGGLGLRYAYTKLCGGEVVEE